VRVGSSRAKRWHAAASCACCSWQALLLLLLLLLLHLKQPHGLMAVLWVPHALKLSSRTHTGSCCLFALRLLLMQRG
jgi:hypothetical protein